MGHKHKRHCREIFVKAVCAKGRLASEQVHTIIPEHDVVDVLGCRITGLRFNSRLRNDSIHVSGEYELQVWIAFDDDSELIRQRVDFTDEIPLMDIGEGCMDVEPEVLVDVVSGPMVAECAVTKSGEVEVVVNLEFHADVLGETRLFVQTCPPEHAAKHDVRDAMEEDWDWLDDAHTP